MGRTIIKGLLRSDNIIRYISDIPCDTIHSLEDDVEEAEKFIDQIQNGQVPDLIKDLPNEAIEVFKDTVGIFLTLPSQIVSVAEAGITEAAKVFNDIGSGAIVSDIENLPGVVLSDITNAWGDLTDGLEDDWNAATSVIGCLIVDCSVKTDAVSSCNASKTQAPSSQTSVTDSSVTPVPHQTGTSSPSNTGSSTPSAKANYSPKSIQIFEGSGIFQLCWLAVLGLVGVALML